MNNLFFMIRPDPAAAAEAVAVTDGLKRDYHLKGRATPAARMHVTTNKMGSYVELPSPVVAAARRAAAQVAFRPFTVAFDRTANFRNKHGLGDNLVVLQGGDGVVGLFELHDRLASALRMEGIRKACAFNPHLSLIYTDRFVPPRPIDPISWRVHEFLLVQSLVGQTRHIVLGRWSLGPASALNARPSLRPAP